MMAVRVRVEQGQAIEKIALQDHAKKWSKKNIEDLHILYEEAGLGSGRPKKRVSERLRNRISLIPQRQDGIRTPDGHEVLPDTHARLNFNDAYGQSVFSFFPLRGNKILSLCNPKIAFQVGAVQLIPPLEGKAQVILPGGAEEKKRYTFEPKDLISHLTAQVLNNLVLHAPQCQTLNPETTEVVLTVPNVYSPTHVEYLKAFLATHTDFAKFSHIYESDAIAYVYALEGNVRLIDRKFCKKINDQIKEKKPLWLVTVDVGKGTTDMSIVELEQTSRVEYKVLSRIGVSKGGNELDYIFADFFNERLKRFLDKRKLEVPFNFLEKSEDASLEQQEANFLLEEIILQLKKHTSATYRLHLGRSLIKGTVADKESAQDNIPRAMTCEEKGEQPGIFHKFAAIACYLRRVASPASESWEKWKENKQFDQDFARFMLAETTNVSWYYGLKLRLGGSAIRAARLNSDLRVAIEAYVSEIGSNLVDRLNENRERRSQLYTTIHSNDAANGAGEKPRETPHEPPPKDRRFMVISGQAAQFKPLHAALVSKAQSKRQFNIKNANIWALAGLKAKEACCYGAVRSRAVGFEWPNEHETLCEYGFRRSAPDNYAPINYKELNDGKTLVKKYRNGDKIDPRAEHYLIYSTVLRPPGHQGDAPSVDDGYTAYIITYPTFPQPDITVEYKKQGGVLEVNDKEVELASYGSIDDPIYRKVWPDSLKP